MNNLKITLTALALSTILFSCKKDKTPDEDCSISIQNISGTYKLTAIKYKATSTSAEVDFLSLVSEECTKDDELVLNANGTYNYRDVGLVCTPNQSENGSWALNGNNLTQDGEVMGTISTFDCKTLVFFEDNTLSQGDRTTYTMVKK
jgi:Lipocalin-like domain